MTLEDFFTLNEMKDGLSTLGRVEELISVMQQQKDCVISNIGDAARQWSTVASTLAVTESKDCLNHFIQLNGLCFLDQWLREAQKGDNDASDNAAQELIEALLTLLERLPTDVEKSYFSEICATLKQLLGRKSLIIKERTRMLFDKWNHVRNDDVSGCNVGDVETCRNADVMEQGSHSIPPIPDVLPCSGGNGEGNSDEKSGRAEGSSDEKSERAESQHSYGTPCPESSQMETTKDVKVFTGNQITPTTSLNLADADAHLLNCFQENLSMVEESSGAPVGMASTCSSPSRQKTKGSIDQNDDSVSKNDEVTYSKKNEVDTMEASPWESGQKDICNDIAVMEPNSPCKSDGKHSERCIPESAEAQQKTGSFDCSVADCLRTTDEFNLLSNGHKGSQDLSRNACIIKNMGDTGTSCNRNDAAGSSDVIEELGSDGDEAKGEDFEVPNDSPKPVEIKETKKTNQELGLELDEEFDPLAIACQVAIEVEREVVDYMEPFCSSSEANSGETTRAHSPDSVQSNKDEPANDELMKEVSLPETDLHDGNFSLKQETSRISEKVTTEPEGCEVDLETRNSSFSAQETLRKPEKATCGFDLNEDVCAEEFYSSTNPTSKASVNLSAPIAVVATSKGAQGLPVAPLQFEGELGWKGSAATSAFRPASPRRTPEGEKAYHASKPRRSLFEIDLNVAEIDGDAEVNPVKPAPVSSGLLSGDSSIEVSSKRAERLKLDLNRLGNEDASPYASTYWRFSHQNVGDHCQSTTSSSSSKQPSMRDFDLNDNPSFLDAGSSQNSNSLNLFKSSGINVISKVDDPVLTLMGSRMTIERKEHSSQAQQSFIEIGPSRDSAMATRPVLQYANLLPPAFACNGFAPNTSISFSPPPYGPESIRYLVDSRTANSAPQVLCPSGLNSTPPATPSFLMSVANASSSFCGGGGSSHPGLDLNSVMTFESGSRLLSEERSVSPSQPAGSGLALKRKEPDCGLEPYPFGYKQVMPWR